jgi:hypothetical protein
MEASTSKVGERREPTGKAMSAVESRLQDLRDLAKTDPRRAQDETWTWIKELGARTDRDREAGSAELNELFRLGTPPTDIEGDTEGILVATTLPRGVDGPIKALTSRWMPWQGKRFQVSQDRGDNLLTRSARFPAKLIWPLYGTRRHPSGRSAFSFEMRVEPGKADPDRDVLVIDYSVIEANPGTIIRQIRDELVELVPDTHLGKILWAGGIPFADNLPVIGSRTSQVGTGWPCIGYFALKQPTG